jgi:hypothetical protein
MGNDDLVARVAALEDELERLKAEATSRRDMFKKLALAGAGAIAGGAVASAAPAGATSGFPLMIGEAHTADRMTAILNGGSISNGEGPLLSTEPTMFWIDNRQSTLANANGIRGDGRGENGSGVWGHSDSGGIAVRADGGIGVFAAGTRAALQLVPLGPPPPQRADAHNRGELVLDDNGDLWLCTASGTPGTWRQLTATPPIPPGLLTPLSAPVRVYDSRQGDGPLAGGVERIVSVAGPPTTPAVPAGSAAALISLTLDETAGAGFIGVFANGISWPGTSNANWYTNGQILAVTTVTAVDAAAKVTVHAGGPGSTQFVIDVVGFYA